MEVRKSKETLMELRAIKNPGAETPEPLKREDGFTMIKGGKGYTIADIEALPEGERAELIDGEMFRMDAAVRRHQDISGNLFWQIMSYIMNKHGNCKVYAAPFAVRIKRDNRNYVEPDISVICDREKLDEKGCQGAPDWVIEILSPSSVTMDCERKVKLYRETGVREYWIVDPEKETVMVYDYEHRGTVQKAEVVYGSAPACYTFSERVRAGIFEDLWLDFSEMDLV